MAQVDLYQYINEIKALLNGNQFAVAAVHCHHVLQSYPRHVETYKLLAKSYLARRQYDEALDLYQRILSADPTDINALLGMARIYNSQKKYEAAARYMAVAVEFDPYNDTFRSRLQELYQRQKQQLPEVGISRAALGILHFRSRLYRQAIQELTVVLKEQPERLDLLIFVAEAYWRLDQHVEADKACQQILSKLPNCIKANAILAEIWLRTDKIAGAQKHLRLVQSLTLPAQNHLDADMPEGRTFLIRDSVNIPKQVAVEYLEEVDVTEDPSLYDTDDGWDTGLGLEDDFVSGFTPAVERGEEVEVDFFSLLESADAEDVFAFDETAEEVHETSGGSNWLSDISQSGQEDRFDYADEGDFASSETTGGLGARVSAAAAHDVPEWLSEIDEGDGSRLSDSADDDEVPTWLNETGELRNPFDTDNMPSWMEDVPQEEEEHSDLFMTEDELAGLWQHEEDVIDEAPVAEPPVYTEDDFSFLDGDNESSLPDSSPFTGEPSLVNSFQNDADSDDSFSFLDFEDDDATGDGFSDWMTATGSNLESPVAPTAESDGDEDDDFWLTTDEGTADSAADNALFSERDESGLGDSDWLNDLGDDLEAVDDDISLENEELETFAFAALEDETGSGAVLDDNEGAEDDLMNFAFMEGGDSSEDALANLSADFDSFGQDDDDDAFSDDAPDWLSDVSNTDQDASILSQQHTARLLMPEGEDAPDWLLNPTESPHNTAEEESSFTFESDADADDFTDDVSWLNDLGSEEPLADDGLNFATADENDSAEWLADFESGLGNEATGDNSEGIAEDDEVELPDWVSGTSPLASVEEEAEDDLDSWLEPPTTSQTTHDDFASLGDDSWLSDNASDQEPDFAPDWLTADIRTDDALDEEDDLALDGDDWLSGTSLEEDSAAAEDPATAGWLSDFGEAEDDDEEEEDDLAIGDDWLSEMSSNEEPVSGESASPDWLGDFGDTESEEEEDDLSLGSDWLSEMSMDEEPTAVEESASPAWLSGFDDDEEDDLVTDGGDWLSEMPSNEQAVAEEMPTGSDWLGDFGEDEEDDNRSVGSDWLSEMSVDDSAAEEESASPDWLGGLGESEDEVETEEIASDGADWLSEMSLQGESTAEEAPATADWLGDFGEDEEDDDLSVGADWLSEMPVEEVPPAAEESATSDWLSSFDDADDEADNATDDLVSDGADWLSEMPSDEGLTAVETAAVPDWLGNFDEDEEEDDSALGSDWLSEMSSEGSAEAEEESEAESVSLDWLGGVGDADEEAVEENAVLDSWLSEMDRESIGDESAEEDDDWLSGTDETTPDWVVGVESAEEEEIVAESLLDEEPDSLLDESNELAIADLFDESVKVLSDDESALTADLETPSLADGDEDGLPDWLRGTITEDARTIDTGRLNPGIVAQRFNEPSVTNDEPETPEWLTAIDDDDSGVYLSSVPETAVEETGTGALSDALGDESDLSEWLEDVAAGTFEEESDIELEIEDSAFATSLLPQISEDEDDTTADDEPLELTSEDSFTEEDDLSTAEADLFSIDEQAEEDDIADSPLDWMTGLPASDATPSEFDDMADFLGDMTDEDKPVTDWLTGEVVGKEATDFAVQETADDEVDYSDDELPAWALSAESTVEEEEEEEDWLAATADSIVDEAAGPESDLSWLRDEETVEDEAESDEEEDDMAWLSADASSPELDAEPDDLTFFDFARDDEEDEPAWLQASAESSDTADDEDEFDIDDILTTAYEEELLDDEPEATPEWFDGMLDELTDDSSSPTPTVATAADTPSSNVPESLFEDGSESDLAEWVSDTADEDANEQLNELAEGLAELAADSYDVDDGVAFDDRPLLETNGDDHANWLTADTVPTDELVNKKDVDTFESFQQEGEDEIPGWLLNDEFSDEEDDIDLTDDDLLGRTEVSPTKPSQPVQPDIEPEELEDVLSWLETIALESDDDS